MAAAGDNVTVVSLDGGAEEAGQSSGTDYPAEPGTTEEATSRPHTAPDRSPGPPPVVPHLW
jgi:hypothetical protein